MTLTQFNRLADMAGLKKRTRDAVWLIEIDGMTGVSAARQMDLSRSTVSRAHARFKRIEMSGGM
jgi:DNA-directed RNA polymerase specialized sigma24 family protein